MGLLIPRRTTLCAPLYQLSSKKVGTGPSQPKIYINRAWRRLPVCRLSPQKCLAPIFGSRSNTGLPDIDLSAILPLQGRANDQTTDIVGRRSRGSSPGFEITS